MRGPVLQGSATHKGVLHVEAKHGHHGETTVLDLLQLSSGKVTLGVAHGVKNATRVADSTVGERGSKDGVLRHGSRGLDVHPSASLSPAHHQQLRHKDSTSGGEIVELTRLVPRHTGSCPLDSRRGSNVGEHDAGNTKHRESAVHNLCLAVPHQVLRILAKAQGIEAEVAGHRPVQVRRGVGPGGPGSLTSHDAHRAYAGSGTRCVRAAQGLSGSDEGAGAHSLSHCR
mmetsp:Transcript_13058/g.24966  ORF Transcript_13058/g.24966 Transcript_13058/m.24966 type:complete len:228 (+) Transcript_13058:675-1358(+)